jgi:hypothetical protein
MGVMVELRGVMGHGGVQSGHNLGEHRPFLKAVPGQDGPPRPSRGRGRRPAAPVVHYHSLQEIPEQLHRIVSTDRGTERGGPPFPPRWTRYVT